jgi:hypothetical protein
MIPIILGWANWMPAEKNLGRNWRPHGSTCAYKKRFIRRQSAAVVADRYNRRVALQFGVFESYWCRTHYSWHNGHRGGRRAISRLLKR